LCQNQGEVPLSAPEVQETLRRASQDAKAVLECSTVLAQSVHAVWRECLSYGQQAIQRHLEGVAELMQARSPGAMLAAQGDLLKAQVELLLNSSRQISEVSAEAANTATKRFEEVNGGQRQRRRARKSA
jgi:predicted component of type VI protein secretion system